MKHLKLYEQSDDDPWGEDAPIKQKEISNYESSVINSLIVKRWSLFYGDKEYEGTVEESDEYWGDYSKKVEFEDTKDLREEEIDIIEEYVKGHF